MLVVKVVVGDGASEWQVNTASDKFKVTYHAKASETSRELPKTKFDLTIRWAEDTFTAAVDYVLFDKVYDAICFIADKVAD
jgi:hypothetical protein